jgi:hypothetical protein
LIGFSFLFQLPVEFVVDVDDELLFSEGTIDSGDIGESDEVSDVPLVEDVVVGVDDEFEGSGDEKSKMSTISESPVLLNPPPNMILFPIDVETAARKPRASLNVVVNQLFDVML